MDGDTEPGTKQPGEISTRPFKRAARVLFTASLAGVVSTFLVLPYAGPVLAGVVFGISALFLPLSLGFLVYPSVLAWKASALYDLPGALNAVRSEVTDLEAVRREHYRARTALEALLKEAGEYSAQVAELQAGLEDRRRQEEELLEQRQQVIRLTKRVEEWADSAIQLFELLERGLAHEELAPPYRQALEKTVRDYQRVVAPLGLDVIRPAPGDPLDDRVHRITGEQESNEVAPGTVLIVEGWGFRIGERVVRKAEVALARTLSNAPAQAAGGPPYEEDGEGRTGS